MNKWCSPGGRALLITALACSCAGPEASDTSPHDDDVAGAVWWEPGDVPTAAVIVPSRPNIDHFLSRACYGIFAFESVEASDTPAALASIYAEAGCKFIRWGDFTWKSDLLHPGSMSAEFFAGFRSFVDELHRLDPDIVVEVGLSEYLCEALIDQAGYDFAAFPGLEQFGAGVFSFAAMIQEGSMDYWGTVPHSCTGHDAVPDLGKPETRLLFRWLAASYLQAGAEAFYLPNTNLTADDWSAVAGTVQMLRELGARYARRGSVLIGGEAWFPFYDARLIDHSDPTSPVPIVDYMKGHTDLDVTRAPGTATTPAQATAVGARTYDCVNSERMRWESALGERLAPGDVCVADSDAIRSGGFYQFVNGTWQPNPNYGEEGGQAAFQRVAHNPFRIPVVMEVDGGLPLSPLLGADIGQTIRAGVNPPVTFFATRDAERRRRFHRYFGWVARHLTAREGIRVYAPAMLKVDGTIQQWQGGLYEGTPYCPGGDDGTIRLFYEARDGICGDVAAIQDGLRTTPGDRGFVALTDHGWVVPQGGGYQLDLRHPETSGYVDIAIAPHQERYYLLDTGGQVFDSATATSSPVPGGIDIELDDHNRPWILTFQDGGCAVRPLSSGAESFACASPVDLGIGRFGDDQVAFVLEADGRLWVQSERAWEVGRELAGDATLDPGETWASMTQAGGDLYVALTFGRVIRLTAEDAVSQIRPPLWDGPYLRDVASLPDPSGVLIYMLDRWGGIHEVPRAGDGQTTAAFPRMFPFTQFGLAGHEFVQLSALCTGDGCDGRR